MAATELAGDESNSGFHELTEEEGWEFLEQSTQH